MKYLRCKICNGLIDQTIFFDKAYGKKDEKAPEYPRQRSLKARLIDKIAEEHAIICSSECERKFVEQFEKKHGLKNAPKIDIENDTCNTKKPHCSICGEEKSKMELMVYKFQSFKEEYYVCGQKCKDTARECFEKKYNLQNAQKSESEHKEFVDPLIQLIADYKKISITEAKKRVEQGPGLVKEDWTKAKPINRDDKIRFYKGCESYIYDLAVWHLSGQKTAEDQRVATLVMGYGSNTIIDYGCGIGDNAIVLAKCGITVYAADMAGKIQDFCKYRVEKTGLSDMIKVVPLDEPYGGEATGREWLGKQKVDTIICLDVLEHLDNHQEVKDMVMWFKTITDNIIATVPLGDEGTHPMHLSYDETLLRWIREQGVILLY